jgi:hypothetical protein
MVRKGAVVVLLLSMFLHASSRLGWVDLLYQKRHQIAYSIGLIAEVPIAMCSQDFNLGHQSLVVKENPSDHTVPPIAHAHEINLFVVDIATPHAPVRTANLVYGLRWEVILYRLDFHKGIFHPPAIG